MNSARKLNASIGVKRRNASRPLSSHETFMALALREAERGLYTAQPNPRVGCLLIKDGEIVGRGFHLQTGQGHAEANALRDAGARAGGATCYVTLEPCSFVGRTPSCADALISAGVKTVVYAMTDPHTRNQGLGLAKLRDAGIDVVGPVLEASARALNPGHIRRFETGLPFVRLKLAMSLDGKTALANGDSQWITSPAARQDVQRLRARSSVVVTGVETVISDDPAMTVRADELQVEYADLAATVTRSIIVMDTHLRIPRLSRILQNPQTQVACSAAAALTMANADHQARSIRTMATSLGPDGRLDIRELLRHLASQDNNEVLFECGATLAGSLVRSGLVDEIVLYMAPRLMGKDARSLLNIPAIGNMGDLIELDIQDVRQVGPDLRLVATITSTNT
jgi:diaminohydroxyphosphoribosylaminopyrimidine deaminase/5-amino-6-(5-phosphoribosylamino)uracil reductase